MSNEPKLTPTLVLTALKSDFPGLYRVEDSDGNPLVRDTTEDRARFIVRAVNAHEALIASAMCAEALDAPYKEGRETLIQYGWDTISSATEFVKSMRRAALKLAKGEVKCTPIPK